MAHRLPVRADRTTATRAHQDPAAPRRRHRPVALGALVALLVVVLAAGCSTVQAFTDLDRALQDEGFTSTRVNVTGGDPVTLTVSADAPSGDTTEEAQQQAARVVWETFPRRFEQVRISIDGEGRTLTAAQLQDQLGDRPAGLDDQGDLGDDVSRVGIGVLVAVLLVGLLVVAAGGLVALLLVRSRRRAAAARPPSPAPPWAPPPSIGGPGPATPPGDAGPVAPPGGWGPPGAPPAPPSPPPHPSWTPTRPVPEGAEHPRSTREQRADARRHGRPVRGARPPESQLPPGWG